MAITRAIATVATLASVANADYFCETLPDQDNQHTWSTPLLNADPRAIFGGDLSYSCNHSSGGVTYNQNLVYLFDYGANTTRTQKVLTNGNDTFRMDMSAPLAIQSLTPASWGGRPPPTAQRRRGPDRASPPLSSHRRRGHPAGWGVRIAVRQWSEQRRS
jgi:hypothetical protein